MELRSEPACLASDTARQDFSILAFFFFVYEKDYKEEQHFNCVTAQLLTVLIC